MVDRVTFARTTFAPVPLPVRGRHGGLRRRRSAWARRCVFLRQFDAAQIEAHERALLQRAGSACGDRQAADLRHDGRQVRHRFVQRRGVHPYDMGMILDKLGIAVRTGQHCAEPVMDHFGVTGMCRASLPCTIRSPRPMPWPTAWRVPCACCADEKTVETTILTCHVYRARRIGRSGQIDPNPSVAPAACGAGRGSEYIHFRVSTPPVYGALIARFCAASSGGCRCR